MTALVSVILFFIFFSQITLESINQTKGILAINGTQYDIQLTKIEPLRCKEDASKIDLNYTISKSVQSGFGESFCKLTHPDDPNCVKKYFFMSTKPS